MTGPRRQLPSQILDRARGVAAIGGAFIGLAAAIRLAIETVDGGSTPSAVDAWSRIAQSAGGIAVLGLFLAVAALVSRFTASTPSLDDLYSLGDQEYVQGWKSGSSELHAWRELVGSVVPTGIAGAGFGFATTATAVAISPSQVGLYVAAIGITLVATGLGWLFVSKRSKELVAQLDRDLSSGSPEA